MEPGVSAEDCLYADIGIDPGTCGCSHFEATQFLIKKKLFDSSSYLILWQVSLTGDTSLTKFSTNESDKLILVNKLLETYPKDHEIIIYECAVLPIDQTRIENIRLKDLATIAISGKTTVIIPPL
jgi:hypothetical protein